MKHFTLLLLFVLASLVVKADSNSNQGMVHLNIGQHKWTTPGLDSALWFSDTVVFRFYARPNDAAPAQTITSYIDFTSRSQRGPRGRHTVTDTRSWLSPMIYRDTTNWGHYVVYMVCSAQKGEWMEVVINESTQEKLWIKRGPYVRFYSWADLAKFNFLTISVNTTVYEKPDTNSAKVKVDLNCFEIKKVQGNWMQITTGGSRFCNTTNQPQLRNVWVKFKTPEKLNITVHYFGS